MKNLSCSNMQLSVFMKIVLAMLLMLTITSASKFIKKKQEQLGKNFQMTLIYTFFWSFNFNWIPLNTFFNPVLQPHKVSALTKNKSINQSLQLLQQFCYFKSEPLRNKHTVIASCSQIAYPEISRGEMRNKKVYSACRKSTTIEMDCTSPHGCC